MFTIYSVCKRCGRIIDKDETTGTGSNTVEGKSYRSIDAKYCGCVKRNRTPDIARIL